MLSFFYRFLQQNVFIIAVFLLSVFAFSTFATAIPPTQKPYVINNIRYYPISSSDGFIDTGIASWYGPDFHGRPTSNGERYDMYAATAAHKILPMNTMLLVKNLENGREIVVRVNDRGPFVRGRILDLSYSSARKLGVIQKGTAKVRIIALARSNKGKLVLPPDFTEGEFYVQIGAFRDQNNAQRLKKRFFKAGHTAVIKQYSVKDSTYYRVQVYVGTQLRHARRAEKALLGKGYSGAFIVAR